MSVLLATLCLNEMEWLPYLYEQHKQWPDLVRWVFVEAADEVYAKVNPELVSSEGLSTDGTTAWLRELAVDNPLVTYIPHGFTGHKEPDQGKCAARQRYLEVAEQIQPQFIFVIDADEFYTVEHQLWITRLMRRKPHNKSFCFPHIHPWRPPSVSDHPLFEHQIIGGFWDIGFIRGWSWEPGIQYLNNHNHISDKDGTNFNEAMADFRRRSGYPTCVHLGFCASRKMRRAKHEYYKARGEGGDDGREWHVESRQLFDEWYPGMNMPRGVTISKYQGPIPECFR